jgi:hypothetical protein
VAQPWAEWDGQRVFDGEVEPCINGRVVTVGAYFGIGVSGIVERLLGEQMADGGWNCNQERGSTRGSFNSTIDVLEGLLEHERAAGSAGEVTAARERGHEYLLERRLLRRLSTGELIESRVQPVLVPDRLPLRRAPRAGLPARSRRVARRAHGRGDRPGPLEAGRRRPVAAREPAGERAREHAPA